MKKIVDYIMHSDLTGPIFWKIWFRWGIRKAMKEQKKRKAEASKRPVLTNDEYWEEVHAKQALRKKEGMMKE